MSIPRVWYVDSVSDLEASFDRRCRDPECEAAGACDHVCYRQMSFCCRAPFFFDYAMGRGRVILCCATCDRVCISIAVPERTVREQATP